MSAFSGLKPSKLKGLVASLEAIDFQKNELLFRNLEIAFDALRKGGDLSDRAIEKAGINKIIKERTGISAVVHVDESRELGAYVIPPQVSANNPLIGDRWKKMLSDNVDAVKAIKTSDGIVDGYVDLEKSKVFGVFSKVDIDVFLTKGLLESKDLSVGEVSAILLHELGHVFTYFEFLRYTVTTNCALAALNKAWLKNKDKQYRITLIKEAEKALNVTLEDPKALAEADNTETLNVVFLDAKVKNNRSELGSKYHDMRSWEFLSDQFASRHGSSRDLAIALDKIYRKHRSSSHMSTPGFLALEVFKVSMFISFVLTLPLLFVVGVFTLMGNPIVSTYDKPGDRIKRIRNDVVEALKDKTNSKERTQRLLSDLDAIDAAVGQIKDRSTFYEYVWRALIPSSRKQYRQQQLQKDLEDLAANAMFEAAAKFKTLS